MKSIVIKKRVILIIIMMPQWQYGAQQERVARPTAAPIMSGAVAGTRAAVVVGANVARMAAKNVYVGFANSPATKAAHAVQKLVPAARDSETFRVLISEAQQGTPYSAKLEGAVVDEIWEMSKIPIADRNPEVLEEVVSHVNRVLEGESLEERVEAQLAEAVRQYNDLQVAKAAQTYSAATSSGETVASGETVTTRVLAVGAEAETELEEVMATAAMIETAMLVINIVLLVAYTTMPYWLPLIYKQSGVCNNTLYQASAFIDFQGAAGASCSRAHFDLAPYNRKDLGHRSWQQVGGDRGRACLPQRYGTRIYLAGGGVTIVMKGAKKESTKQLELFTFMFPQKQGDHLSIVWKSV